MNEVQGLPGVFVKEGSNIAYFSESVYRGLAPNQQVALLESVIAKGFTLRFVGVSPNDLLPSCPKSFQTFLEKHGDGANMLLEFLFDTNTEEVEELLESVKNVSDAERALNASKCSLMARLRQLKVRHVLQEVPSHFSVEKEFFIGKTKIRRKTSNPSNALSPREFESLFEKILAAWQNRGKKDFEIISDIPYQNNSHRVICQSSSVRIGCQSFNRYEIEQLAIHLGWDGKSKSIREARANEK